MTQSSAPVINPSDLAAILARDHGNGFSAAPPRRSGLAAPDGFLPANFAVSALRIVPDMPLPEPGGADPAAEVGTGMAEPEAPPPPARDFDAELAEAFAKGKEAGRAEGLAQGRAEHQSSQQQAATGDMAAARAVFLRAADVLTQTQQSLSAEIASSVEAAVLRLAAQRAGQMITDSPAPFLRRIEQVADRVTQGLRAVRLSLHPEDLLLAEDHLLGFLPPGSVLQGDPALARGDVVVRAPSVTVADLLAGAEP